MGDSRGSLLIKPNGPAREELGREELERKIPDAATAPVNTPSLTAVWKNTEPKLRRTFTKFGIHEGLSKEQKISAEAKKEEKAHLTKEIYRKKLQQLVELSRSCCSIDLITKSNAEKFMVDMAKKNSSYEDNDDIPGMIKGRLVVELIELFLQSRSESFSYFFHHELAKDKETVQGLFMSYLDVLEIDDIDCQIALTPKF